MNMKYLILILLALAGLASCYDEIDMTAYREQEGMNKLALNSVIQPDSVICAAASAMYFYSDVHTEPSIIDNLEMKLWVNGEYRGTMPYDSATHLYRSDVYPSASDHVKISTEYNGDEVSAENVVPCKVHIDSITAERMGPMDVWWKDDFICTYYITFTDDPSEENYYYLTVGYPSGYGVSGQPDFSYDFVYQQLARQINAVTPGWQPDADPLPFSDSGINGTTHTIVIKEIIQGVFGMKYTLHEAKTMRRSFNLYAISKSYYNYLVDLLAFSSVLDDFHSGMIDIGISEPARIYSNVDGGTGIMASFNRTSKVIDVFDYTGPFPDLSDRWKDPWDEDW